MTFLIVIVAVLGLAAVLNVYAISEGAGGSVIWNKNEAYFFVPVDRTGYRASYLQYPFIIAKELLLRVPTIPSETRAFLVVIRVTSSGVERHIVKLADRLEGGAGSDPRMFTPLEGRIYARYPPLIEQVMQDGHLVAMGDALGWWAGDHFEKATQEERRRLDGEKRLTNTEFENDENGWSRRFFVTAPSDSKFTIEVGNEFRLSVIAFGD